MKVKVRHDVIICEGAKGGGYVLDFGTAGWRAAYQACDPSAPPGAGDDDD